MSRLCSIPPSLLSQLGVAGVGRGLGPASPHPPAPPNPTEESGSLASAARVRAPVLGEALSAPREGRLVGGASPGWRPLLAGAALCLSPSLPPARRRSEAELPASPSRSRSGRCAFSAAASLDRDPHPEPPTLGSQRPEGGSPGWGWGGPGRGVPGPRPPDRDGAGPAAARVSLRRRARRPAAPAE